MKNILLILSMTVLFCSTAIAGSLTPPAAPDDAASAMFTLEDVYQRLNVGTAGQKRTGVFKSPTAGPAATGHSLNELMAISPLVDDANGAKPEDVAAGKTFWGLRSDGTWGVQVGTAETCRTVVDNYITNVTFDMNGMTEMPVDEVRAGRVLVTNSAGEPFENITVTISTSSGSVGFGSPVGQFVNATTDASGYVVFSYHSFPNTGTTVLTAVSAGISATVNIDIVAGIPQLVVVTALPGTVAPDGTATVEVVVRDLFGNFVANTPVTVLIDTDSSGGAVLSQNSLTTDVVGKATFQYTAGPSAGESVILVRTDIGAVLDIVSLTVSP